MVYTLCRAPIEWTDEHDVLTLREMGGEMSVFLIKPLIFVCKVEVTGDHVAVAKSFWFFCFGGAHFPFVNKRCHFQRSMPFLVTKPFRMHDTISALV